MAWTGKLVGGGLGWALFGPLGALIGGLIGNAFDRRGTGREIPHDYYARSGPHRDDPRFGHNPGGSFAVALMALVAWVIRADGQVSGAEVRKVREFVMRTFPANAQDLMELLRRLLEHGYDIGPICAQVRAHLEPAERIELLRLLVDVALADGAGHSAELSAIAHIAACLGVGGEELRSVLAGWTHGGAAEPGTPGAANGDYALLGLDPTASNEQLKRAYRERARELHPDRVAHLGEEVRAHAETKFKQLQQAWAVIRKQRGL
jgi:DnaJ like chaperone protein